MPVFSAAARAWWSRARARWASGSTAVVSSLSPRCARQAWAGTLPDGRRPVATAGAWCSPLALYLGGGAPWVALVARAWNGQPPKTPNRRSARQRALRPSSPAPRRDPPWDGDERARYCQAPKGGFHAQWWSGRFSEQPSRMAVCWQYDERRPGHVGAPWPSSRLAGRACSIRPPGRSTPPNHGALPASARPARPGEATACVGRGAVHGAASGTVTARTTRP